MEKSGIVLILAAVMYISCSRKNQQPVNGSSPVIVGDTSIIDSIKKSKAQITSPSGAASTPGGIGIANGSKTVAQH